MGTTAFELCNKPMQDQQLIKRTFVELTLQNCPYLLYKLHSQLFTTSAGMRSCHFKALSCRVTRKVPKRTNYSNPSTRQLRIPAVSNRFILLNPVLEFLMAPGVF